MAENRCESSEWNKKYECGALQEAIKGAIGDSKPGFHSGNQGKQRDYMGGSDYDR